MFVRWSVSRHFVGVEAFEITLCYTKQIQREIAKEVPRFVGHGGFGCLLKGEKLNLHEEDSSVKSDL